MSRRSWARFKPRTIVIAMALGLVAAVGIAVGGAGAAHLSSVKAVKGANGESGIVDVSRYLGRNSRVPVQVDQNKFVPMKRAVRLAKQLRVKEARIQKRQRSARRGRSFMAASPAVGTTRTWLALDDSAGFYRKQFTLREVSAHTEIWVATPVVRSFNGFTSVGTDFPAGDCRNGARTVITDAQVDYLADQFDNNMLPKESAQFSVAPDRDGTHQTPLTPLPPGPVPSDSSGAGEKTVVLVDNVRDDNFRDFNNTEGNSYIAGFFSSGLNELFDRNVMSIDAFDWLHRTGANPAHEPVPGNNCTSAPARPFLYEGVFAHEYQHLLEYYQDAEEVNWVNEGLSDYAIDVTGYDFATRPVSQIGFDSHLQCFMGNLIIQTDANPNPRGGGPENSLTLWGDQGDDEILCDYGAAFSMMEYLRSQYGAAFMTALHRNPEEGFAGLQNVLGTRATAQQIVHQWAAAMALDGVLDNGGKLQHGVPESRYQIDALHAGINWDNPDAYSTPGAPPNGADYIRLRDGAGYLRAKDIKSLTFQGASTLEAVPVEWTVTTSAPDHGTDPALAAPDADNRDAAIVKSVAVPAGTPTLVFDTKYDTEPGFDSFFVQVSTDGGATYHSLANADTTCDLDPGANANLLDNCPGLNGDSGGWVTETFDLTPYAGQTILLALRYVTDANTRGSGVWVDNVRVGGTLVSDGSSLAGWQTFTQIRPIPVNGYTVQLVGYQLNGKKPHAFVASVPLSSGFAASLTHGKLERLIGEKADVVAALVTYDEPTESINQYARYTLKVNGVVQPGG